MLKIFMPLSILAIIAFFTVGRITAHQLMLQQTTLATCKISDQSAVTIAQSHVRKLKLWESKLELETDDLTLQSIHLKEEQKSKKRYREEDEEKEPTMAEERLLAYCSQNQLRDWQVSTFVYVCECVCVFVYDTLCVCVRVRVRVYTYTHIGVCISIHQVYVVKLHSVGKALEGGELQRFRQRVGNRAEILEVCASVCMYVWPVHTCFIL